MEPAKEVRMGILRSITLFAPDAYRPLAGGYDYLRGTELLADTFGNNEPLVVGLLNQRTPLLCALDGKDDSVYADFSYLDEEKLIRIADSIPKLGDMLRAIEIIWRGREKEISLLKTPGNISASAEVLEQFAKANPRSNADFWKYLAFRELGISLE